MNAVPAMAATSHWQRGGCGPHHDIARQLKNTPKSGRPKKTSCESCESCGCDIIKATCSITFTTSVVNTCFWVFHWGARTRHHLWNCRRLCASKRQVLTKRPCLEGSESKRSLWQTRSELSSAHISTQSKSHVIECFYVLLVVGLGGGETSLLTA